MKIAILNTTIATTDGLYEIETIDLDEARDLINNQELESAIGHQSTADILNKLLKTNLEVNRQVFLQEEGQVALVFKLKGRPKEGRILNVTEIEKIGYSFKKMTRLK